MVPPKEADGDGDGDTDGDTDGDVCYNAEYLP
jgi:hypothetical protein